MCLQYQKTRTAAMKHAIEWVEYYIGQGSKPPGVEATLHACFTYWHTIYKTRLDVIAHIFSSGGNGYDWLDGGITCTSPEDYLEVVAREAQEAPKRELYKQCAALLVSLGEVYMEEPEHETSWTHVSESSLINRVPDDVQPDWLRFAYEAAKTLRDLPDPDRATRAWKQAEERNLGKRYDGMDDATWEAQTARQNAYVEGALIHNRLEGARIVEDLERQFPQLVGALQV